MKAVVLKGYGGVEHLELTEVAEPSPGPKDLKVRVAAIGINPIDYKARRGDLRGWMPLELPAVLGRDVAGEVVARGADVSGFEVGDRVLGLVSSAYAELVVAPAEAFAKMPPELEMEEAASLPLVGLTGAQLIEEAAQVRDDQTVLVTGAVGGVGRVAVFVARQRGARVLAGVRSSQRQAAEALDVETIHALDDPDDLAHLPSLDAIADTVGGEALDGVLDKLAPTGTLGTVLGEPPRARERGLSVRPMLTHPDSRRLAELAQSLALGRLVLPIHERFALEDIRRAHAVAESPGTGKVVLLVSGGPA